MKDKTGFIKELFHELKDAIPYFLLLVVLSVVLWHDPSFREFRVLAVGLLLFVIFALGFAVINEYLKFEYDFESDPLSDKPYRVQVAEEVDAPIGTVLPKSLEVVYAVFGETFPPFIARVGIGLIGVWMLYPIEVSVPVEQVAGVSVGGGVLTLLPLGVGCLVWSLYVSRQRRVSEVEEAFREERTIRAAAEEDLLDTWYGFIEFTDEDGTVLDVPRENISLREIRSSHYFVVEIGDDEYVFHTDILPWSDLPIIGTYDGSEVDNEDNSLEIELVDGLEDLDYNPLHSQSTPERNQSKALLNTLLTEIDDEEAD